MQAAAIYDGGHSPRESSLTNYLAQVNRGARFDLEEATRRVHLGTTHADNRRVGLSENWLQWSLGGLYPPLARTQDPQRLLAGGCGDCSERSAILKAIAEAAGRRCRFVGLNGHVVLEVETAAGWRVADPDYGVAYSFDAAALARESARPVIEATLADRGYPQETIDRYLAIVQSADNNVSLPVDSSLSPRLHAVEQACQWLIWLIPAACIVLGIAAGRGARNR